MISTRKSRQKSGVIACSKAQSLAKQIQELKKQRRGTDRAIQKAEQELKSIFDQAGIDSLEIEIGLLVRRKTEKGYEWIVEI